MHAAIAAATARTQAARADALTEAAKHHNTLLSSSRRRPTQNVSLQGAGDDVCDALNFEFRREECWMSEPVPPHAPPILFALNAMLLELILSIRDYFQTDLESLLIILCVADATMAPTTRSMDEQAHGSRSNDRGAISRRMIASRTGLSREMVRRKARKLAKAGIIEIDEEGRVRSGPTLADSRLNPIVDAAHQVVLRYLSRLSEIGVDPQGGRRGES